MYHIKDDKRSRNSAKLVCQGFDLCLEKKDFSKITVADVLDKSTVGRATFYRLFDSMYDILLYKCDLVFEDMADKFSKLDEKIEDVFVFFVSRWMEQDCLLEAIVSANRLDILYDSCRNHAALVKGIFNVDLELKEEEADYLIAIVTSSIVGVLDIWIKHNKAETVHELCMQMKKYFGMFYHSMN